MSQPLIGEIRMFAGDFAPRGWQFCHGQLLDINQNSALFAILGTTYGGDGRVNFALPDLRGRVPIQQNTSAYGPQVKLGQKIAHSFYNALTVSNIPAHNHSAQVDASQLGVNVSAQLKAYQEVGNTNVPTGNRLADTKSFDNEYLNTGTSVDMASDAIEASGTISGTINATTGITGRGDSFSIVQPSLGLNFIIALQGIFPS